ncbi:hypothetical protein KQI36_10455 [Clostridium senegalense]|uniref:hypothetical protein n=1 Tax=Clostridium senegalense TaxID=1465809 RepID=UPI001C10FE33|nr:hypothetical protein [Clostridium senegalense]MBU5227060.1 hypothetical protein [Clostridium senegalense]
MSKRKRYFIIVSHCLLNPATRVHLLGKNFIFSQRIIDYFLDKHISIIQLPCPEFTAMGYLRNPQGREQYDNIFFKKHCKKELQSYVDMVCELRNNNNTPLCYIGIQGSPTCSIYWGKHKVNKYNTESMMPDLNGDQVEGTYGVMTAVLDDMLKENKINIPYLEVPVKENIDSEKSIKFFNDLYELLGVPEKSRNT